MKASTNSALRVIAKTNCRIATEYLRTRQEETKEGRRFQNARSIALHRFGIQKPSALASIATLPLTGFGPHLFNATTKGGLLGTARPTTLAKVGRAVPSKPGRMAISRCTPGFA